MTQHWSVVTRWYALQSHQHMCAHATSNACMHAACHAGAPWPHLWCVVGVHCSVFSLYGRVFSDRGPDAFMTASYVKGPTRQRARRVCGTVSCLSFESRKWVYALGCGCGIPWWIASLSAAGLREHVQWYLLFAILSL